MRLSWSSDSYCLDGIVPQDLCVGSDGSAPGVLLAQGAKGVLISVADRGECLEVVKIPDQVLPPISRSHHCHARDGLLSVSCPRFHGRSIISHHNLCVPTLTSSSARCQAAMLAEPPVL